MKPDAVDDVDRRRTRPVRVVVAAVGDSPDAVATPGCTANVTPGSSRIWAPAITNRSREPSSNESEPTPAPNPSRGSCSMMSWASAPDVSRATRPPAHAARAERGMVARASAGAPPPMTRQPRTDERKAGMRGAQRWRKTTARYPG